MKNLSFYDLRTETKYPPEDDHKIHYLKPGAYPSVVITSMNDSHYATVEDTFQDGSECLLVVSALELRGLQSEKIVEISFRDISGNIRKLRCVVDWFLKTASMYKKVLLGMKIVNPTTGCREFIKRLQS